MTNRENAYLRLEKALMQMHGPDGYGFTLDDVKELEESAWGALHYIDELEKELDLLRKHLRELEPKSIMPIKSTTKQKELAYRLGIVISEFWCGACQFNLIGRPKFCPNCGKAVKWEAVKWNE